MRRLIIALSIAVAAVTTALAEQKIERRAGGTGGGTCSSTNFETVTYVGGNSNNFCESGYGGTGLAMSTITLWYVPDFVVGIQGVYTDGTASPVYGRQANNVVSIDVNYDQSIVFDGAILWTGGASGYVHTVYLGNSHSGAIIAGESQPNQNGLARHAQSVGSGVLYGFTGSTTQDSEGVDIDGLGFLFGA